MGPFHRSGENRARLPRHGLHRSTDGTRVINYAHWRSQADFDAFLSRHRPEFGQFLNNASRIDPHTYEVVFIDEAANS